MDEVILSKNKQLSQKIRIIVILQGIFLLTKNLALRIN